MTAAAFDLVLRADANPTVGAGHAMRLAALGAAWLAAGGRARVAGDLDLGFVTARYREIGIPITDEPARAGEVVVVDSYDPGIRFRVAQLPGPALRVMVDDLGGEVPSGYDVVWNPSPFGRPELYQSYLGRVLGGIDRLAIREDLSPWDRGSNEVIVSLGGSEPDRQIKEAFEQLARLAPEVPFAMAGSWGPTGWRRVAPEHFWRETARARAMITGAGGTVWEAAVVGIPVVLLEIAPNQRLIYRWARDAGVPGLKTSLVDADFLAHQLRALLPAARPLPRVQSGTRLVAAELAQLAADRQAAR